MNRILRLSFCVIMCGIVLELGIASEKKIAKKDVPPEVLSAFEKKYPTANIKGFSMVKEEGKTFYEIESLDGTTSRDVLYTPDGTVAEIEEVIPPDELPKVVRDGLMKKHKKAIILRAESTMKEDRTTYEVLVKIGKKKREITVDAAGSVLREK